MNQEQLNSLHTNQRLFISELLSRGVECTLLVQEIELIEAKYGNHVELLLDRDSTACPYPSSILSADKYVTKLLLQRAGITTARGQQFYPDQHEDALRYAESLTYPLVVKPSKGSHGFGCSTDCQSLTEVAAAITRIAVEQGRRCAFLIEEQIEGHEYRIFVTKQHKFAALRRDPAAVTGDGFSTIRQLAETDSYNRMNPRVNCLCPIMLDEEVERHLERTGLSLESVLQDGEFQSLRRNSNIALGGTCEDVTDRAHPAYLLKAQQVLECFPGLPYAGIDIITPDIATDPRQVIWGVLEVNSNPGVHMHARPAFGKGQPVASYLADIVFPETRASTMLQQCA